MCPIKIICAHPELNSINVMDFGKKCIILTRVSTIEQDYQFQLDALYKYAEELGLDKPLTDISTKESGFRTMESKDGFRRVIDFMKKHDCRIVLCTELSRLAREKIILEQIKDWFVTNKIQLYIKDQGFRLFNENGEIDMATDIIFSVYASMAQSEMKEKRKRMSRGLGSLLSSGYSLVGPPPFGYLKRKTSMKINGKYRNELVVNDSQAEQIRTIFHWYLEGIDGDRTRCSFFAIQKECIARGYDQYLTSLSNLKKCMKNEGYTGSKTTHNKHKNPAFWDYGHTDEPHYINSQSHTIKYPPIISRELFDAVQAKMRAGYNHIENNGSNVYADKSRTHITILAKTIICPECGCYLTGNYRMRNGRMENTYRCSHHHPNRTTLSMPLFDALIWSFCKSNWKTYLTFLKKTAGVDTSDAERRIENYQKKIDEIKNEKETYLEQIITYGPLSEKLKAKVDKKVKSYDSQISSIKNILLKESESLAVIKGFKNFAYTEEAIESSKAEMRKYIQLMIQRIEYVYKTKRLYLIKVTLTKDVKVPFTTNDAESPNDTPVYLIIDGIQARTPKIRCIYSPSIVYCNDNNTFQRGDVTYTIQDVFEDTDDLFSREVLFKPLKVYENDIPKQQM